MKTTPVSSKADEARSPSVAKTINDSLLVEERRRQVHALAEVRKRNEQALKKIGLRRFGHSAAVSAAHAGRRRNHAQD